MLKQMQAGQILLADRAYDSGALRQTLAERGAWANVKPMPNRKNVPAFSAFLYRRRNLVERFFNKLKHWRGVATRYDKRADNYLAGVKLASARIWMRFNESVAKRGPLRESAMRARPNRSCEGRPGSSAHDGVRRHRPNRRRSRLWLGTRRCFSAF
jgi:transposase